MLTAHVRSQKGDLKRLMESNKVAHAQLRAQQAASYRDLADRHRRYRLSASRNDPIAMSDHPCFLGGVLFSWRGMLHSTCVWPFEIIVWQLHHLYVPCMPSASRILFSLHSISIIGIPYLHNPPRHTPVPPHFFSVRIATDKPSTRFGTIAPRVCSNAASLSSTMNSNNWTPSKTRSNACMCVLPLLHFDDFISNCENEYLKATVPFASSFNPPHNIVPITHSPIRARFSIAFYSPFFH